MLLKRRCQDGYMINQGNTTDGDSSEIKITIRTFKESF